MKTFPYPHWRLSSLVVITGFLLLATGSLHAGSKDCKPAAPPESPLDDKDGYTNNTITHGVQLPTGIAFR